MAEVKAIIDRYLQGLLTAEEAMAEITLLIYP